MMQKRIQTNVSEANGHHRHAGAGWLRHGEKGLTLIELLIVIAILGIVAAVVVPNVGAFRTTGTLAAANKEAENVKTAALAYYSEWAAWDNVTPDAMNSGDGYEAYIAGELRARYEFDDSGFIVSVAEEHTWGDAIRWSGDSDGHAAGERRWVRNG